MLLKFSSLISDNKQENTRLVVLEAYLGLSKILNMSNQFKSSKVREEVEKKEAGTVLCQAKHSLS